MFPVNFFNLFTAAAAGLLIGSFLNVVIYRLPHKQKILNLHTRSKCPHCRKVLKAYDLVPVFSFLWLKGRCRYCHHAIGFQYPLVELITAGAFTGIAYAGQGQAVFLLYFIAALMIVIFFVDLNTHYIYDITLWALFLTIGMWAVLNQVWISNLMWAAGAGLFFYLLAFLGEKIYHKPALGEGDIPLAALIAFLAGSQLTLISFYSAFILGGVAALFLLLTGKAKRGTELPFAPFLISGWVPAVLIHVF